LRKHHQFLRSILFFRARITYGAVETRLGRFPCRVERPEPLKFAWPIVLLPELFTNTDHLAVMLGYLATIGWEVFAPDLRAVAGQGPTPTLVRMRMEDLVSLAAEALDAVGSPAIVLGHGLGGLIALKLAETGKTKAAVALAPLVPGVRNALISGWPRFAAKWLGRPLSPPSGRVLFEFLLDVDAFQRPAMVSRLAPDAIRAAGQIASGEFQLAARRDLPPRLIIAGAVDPFVPLDKVTALAQTIGAQFITAKGRGHWLIGGRGLERTIGEAHRFLVRTLGQDLLLLYPEAWKAEGEDGEPSQS
jgi:pimeloyl-ACP methyl ester carboxylesterase